MAQSAVPAGKLLTCAWICPCGQGLVAAAGTTMPARRPDHFSQHWVMAHDFPGSTLVLGYVVCTPSSPMPVAVSQIIPDRHDLSQMPSSNCRPINVLYLAPTVYETGLIDDTLTTRRVNIDNATICICEIFHNKSRIRLMKRWCL